MEKKNGERSRGCTELAPGNLSGVEVGADRLARGGDSDGEVGGRAGAGVKLP